MLCKQIFLYYVVDVVNVMKEQPSKSGCFFFVFLIFHNLPANVNKINAIFYCSLQGNYLIGRLTSKFAI